MKRKVLIAVHQLNIGGVQKALISALNAIDYTTNDVTLYIRKNRVDLLSSVNENVSKIIINNDNTKYYRKPYSILLQCELKLLKLLKKDCSSVQKKLYDYIFKKQMEYEKEYYFTDNVEYDVAVSYIQSHTAKFVADNINAKKYVMFYHGSTDEFHQINAEVMRSYNKIICVSKNALAAIAECYPEHADKMDYIENVVDYQKVRADANVFDPNYPEDKLVLCSCGRITSVKGYDLAVKAAKQLKDNGIGFVWYFVGDGAERAKIDELISVNNLNEEIVITGLVDNPYPYIKNCDIYVQPSYEEAHPLSIIEAQILGKIVVSTATSGGKSIITNEINGIIADISAEAIAKKVMYLCDNKPLCLNIKNALAEKDFSKEQEHFREKWKSLLED